MEGKKNFINSAFYGKDKPTVIYLLIVQCYMGRNGIVKAGNSHDMNFSSWLVEVLVIFTFSYHLSIFTKLELLVAEGLCCLSISF